jgi:hypothetical protein
MIFIARSPEMIGLMTGVDGIGSYVGGGLAGATPPRAFTAIASKIGCGDELPPPACGFSHDCAIVCIDRGGDPDETLRYMVVALGGHPGQARVDLQKMVVRFHDCVVALSLSDWYKKPDRSIPDLAEQRTGRSDR